MTDNRSYEPDVIDDLTTAEPDNEEKSSSTKALAISKHMIPSKTVFALAGAVAGSFYPYINVFLTSIGLTVSAAGFIGGIRLVSSAIVGPLWGILIDYTGQRKFIFTLLCLGTGFTIFSLPWTAQYISSQYKNETYKQLSTHDYSTLNPYNTQFQGNLYTHGNVMNQYGFTSQLFYVMLFTIIISNFFDIPLQGLIDSFVMNVAQSKGHNDSFGMQKVYHSVFFGLANFLAGVAADQFKHSKILSKYTAIFFVFLPSALLLIPTGLVLLRQTKWKPNQKQCCNQQAKPNNDNRFRLIQKLFKNQKQCCNQQAKPNNDNRFRLIQKLFKNQKQCCNQQAKPNNDNRFRLIQKLFKNQKQCCNQQAKPNNDNRFRLIQKLFKNLDNIVFMFSVCLVGVASAVLLGYLFMLMDHEMNATKSCMGLSVLVSCLVQVLLFPSSHRIIKRIGAMVCIELALLSYFIRFMMIAYITNPYLIILTQLFHCVGFALFWAAAVEHVQVISPKEIYCTMYSVLTSVYWGLGGIIGNILGGFVFTHFGGRWLFRGTAILCAVWACVMIFYFHVFKRLFKTDKIQPKVAVITSNNVQEFPLSG